MHGHEPLSLRPCFVARHALPGCCLRIPAFVFGAGQSQCLRTGAGLTRGGISGMGLASGSVGQVHSVGSSGLDRELKESAVLFETRSLLQPVWKPPARSWHNVVVFQT